MLPSSSFPEDDYYRYGLSRMWGSTPYVLWLLANPSTANAMVDDRTIYEVCRFTERLIGLQAIVVMNLYAKRATKPEALRGQGQLVGDADRYITQAASGAATCVVAWGCCLAGIRHNDVPFEERVKGVCAIVSGLEPLFCLGPERVHGRTPWHPLHAARQPAPGVQRLLEWRPDRTRVSGG